MTKSKRKQLSGQISRIMIGFYRHWCIQNGPRDWLDTFILNSSQANITFTFSFFWEKKRNESETPAKANAELRRQAQILFCSDKHYRLSLSSFRLHSVKSLSALIKGSCKAKSQWPLVDLAVHGAPRDFDTSCWTWPITCAKKDFLFKVKKFR